MKVAIIHQEGCPAARCDHIIDVSGKVARGAATGGRLHGHATREKRGPIEIVLRGDLDERPPSVAQLRALEALLLELKLRYPDLRVGGHSQVRGAQTECPGRSFPLAELKRWVRDKLPEARDATLAEEIFRQYRPGD